MGTDSRQMILLKLQEALKYIEEHKDVFASPRELALVKTKTEEAMLWATKLSLKK